MKKFLLIVLLLIVILVVVLGVLIATFDVNRYKTDIESILYEKTGYPVKIGSLSLGFKNGLAIQANNLSLDGKLKSGQGAFSFIGRRFFMKLELKPLLQKEIRVSEVLIDAPQLTYFNDAAQPINAPQQVPIPETIPPSSTTSTTSSTTPSPASPIPADSPLSQFEISKIIISDGTFVYGDKTKRTALTFSIQNVQLEVNELSIVKPVQFNGSADLLLGSPKKLQINGTFSYPEQSVYLNGNLNQEVKLVLKANQIFRRPSLRIDTGITNLDIASFFDAEQKKAEYFSGTLSGNVSLQAGGNTSMDLVRTLSGTAKLDITDGALKNRNLLSENLNKITSIPGLNILFTVDLGPRFQELLQSPDTAFQKMELVFGIDTWKVNVERLNLIHPDYLIQLEGVYMLDQSVDFAGLLLIGEELGLAMIKKVKELAYLADEKGQIPIPFVVRGQFPGFSVTPNVSAVVQKTIENVGAELLGQALDSFFQPKEEPAQQ